MYQHKSENIEKFIVYSIMIHFIVLISIFVLSTYSPTLFKNVNKLKMKLSKTAIRVDVVSMPKMTLKELKKISGVKLQDIDLKVEKKKLFAREKSKIEFIKKKKKKNFMSMLKNLADRKVKKKKSGKKSSLNNSKRNAITGEMRKELKNLIVAGNKISKGSSLTSEFSSKEVADVFNQYIQSIPDLVRPNWKLPSYLLEKGLQCRIRLFLGPDGNLLKLKIFESSESKEYDKRALNAIRLTAPFPPLNREIIKSGAEGDIILGFPL